MPKTVTETIVEELKKYGIVPTVVPGARHAHIKWQISGHPPRMHVGSDTWQKHALTFIRAKADIRRMLRQDGVPLEAVLEDRKKQLFQKAISAPELIEATGSKLERLEKELEAMVDFMFELRENINSMTAKARQEGRLEGIDLVLGVLRPSFETSLTTIENLKVNYSANELQDRRLAVSGAAAANGHAMPGKRKRHPFDANHPILGYLLHNSFRTVEQIWLEVSKSETKTKSAVQQTLYHLVAKGLVQHIREMGYRLGSKEVVSGGN